MFGDTFELVGSEVNLSSAMAGYWTNMASSGDPNVWKGPRATPAPRARPAKPAVQVFGSPPPDLGPGVRSKTDNSWWTMPRYDCGGSAVNDAAPGMQCGAGMTGYLAEAQCEQVCLADLHCGGISVHSGSKPELFFLRPANCSTTLRSTRPPHVPGQPPSPPVKGGATMLLVLKDRPEPRPPGVGELPAQCKLFTLNEKCMNISDGYRTIPVNVTLSPSKNIGRFERTMLNTDELGRCCEACLSDGDKCKYWFVPTNTSNITGRGVGTECVLVSSAPSGSKEAKGGGSSVGCVGALAPAWIPPPQCHDMFQPFQPSERVLFNRSRDPKPGVSVGRCGTIECVRTVLPSHTLESCCKKTRDAALVPSFNLQWSHRFLRTRSRSPVSFQVKRATWTMRVRCPVLRGS